MSQYLNIYLRKNNKYIYLTSFSCSSPFVALLLDDLECYVPYEDLVKVKDSNGWLSEVNQEITKCELSINELHIKQSNLAKWVNTVEEKERCYDELQESIKYYNEQIENAQILRGMLILLLSIDEDTTSKDFKDDGIYIGVEAYPKEEEQAIIS